MRSVSWPTRILGFLLVLLVLGIALGQGMTEGVTPLFHPTGVEVGLLLCLLLMLAAVIVSWRWEIAGALVGVSGFIAFWLINLLGSSQDGLFQALPLFPLLGLLFVILWWRYRTPGTPKN